MLFIQLLSAIILNNFSFGSSFKNTIIRRVPDDCSDLTSVKIDEIRTNCQNNSEMLYVIYANRSMHAKVRGITKDHLPIVSLEDQPQVFGSSSKQSLRNCETLHNYVFNDFTYSLKTTNQLIGFNYLWLGCPQSLCLTASIDAATSLSNQTVYLFRGNYFWDLNYPPIVSKAIKISEWKGSNNNNDSEFNKAYFDAVVTNKYFTSFYRNERQFIWDLETKAHNSVNLSSLEFEFKMDAAFYVKDDLTYYLKGSKFMTDKDPFIEHYIQSMGIPWDSVDAAFSTNQRIYLFKGCHYLQLGHNISLPLKPKHPFKDLYKCPEILYEKFGGYDSFLNLIATKDGLNTALASNDSFNEIKIIKINETEEYDHGGSSILVILIVVITLIIIILVLRRKFRQLQ